MTINAQTLRNLAEAIKAAHAADIPAPATISLSPDDVLWLIGSRHGLLQQCATTLGCELQEVPDKVRELGLAFAEQEEELVALETQRAYLAGIIANCAESLGLGQDAAPDLVRDVLRNRMAPTVRTFHATGEWQQPKEEPRVTVCHGSGGGIGGAGIPRAPSQLPPPGYAMTTKAYSVYQSYAAFRTAGWTDAQLIEGDYMCRVTP